MITFRNYVKAESLEEAYNLNLARNSKIIGGMLWVRQGKAHYNTVIDISGLELNKIEEDDLRFRIGAMVTLRELENHTNLNLYTNNSVQKAIKNIVGVQFRNLATIGGSIWGRFGFSDVLTVFLALDCYVELYKGGIVPLEAFSKMKYDNDILVSIIINKKSCRCVYDSVRIQRTDFPVLTCAASIIDGEYRVVVGARPARALVFRDENRILTGRGSATCNKDKCLPADSVSQENITPEAAAAFAEELSSKVPTSGNSRGSAKYRSHLVKVLSERNLKLLGEMTKINPEF